MRRIDWWLGVTLLAAVVALHAFIPRYQLFMPTSPHRSNDLIRLDRWTGRVESGSFVTAPDGPQWIWIPLPELRR
jgi:hypothetical protein